MNYFSYLFGDQLPRQANDDTLMFMFVFYSDSLFLYSFHLPAFSVIFKPINIFCYVFILYYDVDVDVKWLL